MVKYIITVDVSDEGFHVVVSKDGRFADEAEFTPDEAELFTEYIATVCAKVIIELKKLKSSFSRKNLGAVT